MSRCPFIGGNWKSNGTKQSVEALVKSLNNADVPTSVEVVVAPTFIHLDYVLTNLKKKSISVAAQTASTTGTGAFTGEIAASQLKDFGIPWVILGHSERRQYYGATNEVLAKQLKESLKSNLKVIFCVGETLNERKANHTWNVIETQLNVLVNSLGNDAQSWNSIVIAYEPVWAIGTGETATPQQAEEVHAQIREYLTKKVSDNISKCTRIIYGGSVKGSNAIELMNEPNIDGFLVGGASLIPDDFQKIILAPTKTNKIQSKSQL